MTPDALAALAAAGGMPLALTGEIGGDMRKMLDQLTDTAKAGEAARKFVTESNELAKVAATGDAAAVKVAFGKLGAACKGCHDDFRKKD